MKKIEPRTSGLAANLSSTTDDVPRSLGEDTQGQEFELKLEAQVSMRRALLKAIDADGEDVQEEPLFARYFDTIDGRLAAAGITLRLRREQKTWVQTAKVSPDGQALRRAEHEVTLRRRDKTAEPNLALHDGSEVGTSLRAALHGETILVERFNAHVTRHKCRLRHGESLIEVALDVGHLEAGQDRAPIHEIEFELKEGKPRDASALATGWARRYGLWIQADAKAMRGERLASGTTDPPVVKSSALSLNPSLPPDAIVRLIMRNCLSHALPNITAIAAGSRNPDHIHQARVGLRRLRTALREFAKLVTTIDPEWEPPLARAFRDFGVFRDQRTVMDALRPRLIKAGAPGVGWTENTTGGPDPAATAKNPDLQTALLEIIGFAHDAPVDVAVSLRQSLRRRLLQLNQQVVRDGHKFRELSAVKQHQTRKRLKRLRYLSEFAAPLFDARRVDRYLDGLRPAQDALGRHNDDAMALVVAKQAAEQGDADARFASKWLKARLKKSAKSSRRALRKLDESPRTWRGSS